MSNNAAERAERIRLRNERKAAANQQQQAPASAPVAGFEELKVVMVALTEQLVKANAPKVPPDDFNLPRDPSPVASAVTRVPPQGAQVPPLPQQPPIVQEVIVVENDHESDSCPKPKAKKEGLSVGAIIGVIGVVFFALCLMACTGLGGYFLLKAPSEPKTESAGSSGLQDLLRKHGVKTPPTAKKEEAKPPATGSAEKVPTTVVVPTKPDASKDAPKPSIKEESK